MQAHEPLKLFVGNDEDHGYASNAVVYALADLIQTADAVKASGLTLKTDHTPQFTVNGSTHNLAGCRIGDNCMLSLFDSAFSDGALKALRRGRVVYGEYTLPGDKSGSAWSVHAVKRNEEICMNFIRMNIKKVEADNPS